MTNVDLKHAIETHGNSTHRKHEHRTDNYTNDDNNPFINYKDVVRLL